MTMAQYVRHVNVMSRHIIGRLEIETFDEIGYVQAKDSV